MYYNSVLRDFPLPTIDELRLFYLFPGNARNPKIKWKTGFTSTFKSLMEGLGNGKSITPHSLRQSFNDFTASRGLSTQETMAFGNWMGHQMSRYLNSSPQQYEATANKLSRRQQAAVNPDDLPYTNYIQGIPNCKQHGSNKLETLALFCTHMSSSLQSHRVRRKK
jgi:integrase